jgi:hypothetical protein
MFFPTFRIKLGFAARPLPRQQAVNARHIRFGYDRGFAQTAFPLPRLLREDVARIGVVSFYLP